MQLSDPARPRHFVEHDGYQVQHLVESGAQGLRGFHLVVKRTYRIEQDAPAQHTRWQRPLRFSDSFYEDDPNPIGTPLRYETELTPPKPACDVILNGHCYPPGGEATTCVASLKVADVLHKKVRVVGDRSAWWSVGAKRAEMTGARPFSVMPLRWDFAYGGVDQSFPTGPLPHPANPAGVGYWVAPPPGMDDVDRWGALPNLEDPDRPLSLDHLKVDVRDWQSGPHPWGFGAVPRFWAPRAQKAGLDPSVRPLWDMIHANPPPGAAEALPFREMQPDFLNAAPAGQTMPYPTGGERVVLQNLHPTEEELRFRLPTDRPRLAFDFGKGLTSVPLKVDTVVIEPDLMALDVIWRGRVPAPEGFSVDQMGLIRFEVDGKPELPCKLLDTGFPIELLTGGHP